MFVEWNDRALAAVERQPETTYHSARGCILVANSRLARGNGGAAFSDNTKKTYQTHLRSYIAFCEQSGIVPVPVK